MNKNKNLTGFKFRDWERGVATLVNQIQNAGYYVIDFDGSNLSSGVYFYKLAVDGNIIDTKRMVLLK